MAYFATFFQFAVYPVGSTEVIEACGDRAIIILDGRESTLNHERIAARVARERGYVGYKLHKGLINGPHVSTMLRTVYRYSACLLDGTELYKQHTAQAIGDAVIAHEEAAQGRGPQIAYTYDHKAGQAFPYTTWARDESGHWVGSQHRSFDDVRAAVITHA